VNSASGPINGLQHAAVVWIEVGENELSFHPFLFPRTFCVWEGLERKLGKGRCLRSKLPRFRTLCSGKEGKEILVAPVNMNPNGCTHRSGLAQGIHGALPARKPIAPARAVIDTVPARGNKVVGSGEH
jgi:hypothetical protein